MQKKDLYLEAKALDISSNIMDEIVCDHLQIDTKDLLFLEEIDNDNYGKIKNSMMQFLQGIPIEYITGKAYFYSIPLYVDNGVLIPRNETELMVDKILELINEKEDVTYIDIGTGSGNIGIAVCLNNSKIKNIYLLDVSEKAIKISEKNVGFYKLQNRINILQSNLLDVFLDKENDLVLHKNIVISANLPYVKNNDYINMDKETFMFEPSIALFGGKGTGFEIYQEFINQVIKLKQINKAKNFVAFIEIGFDQSGHVKEYLKNLYLEYYIYKDNLGIDRCVKIIF